MDGTRDGGYVPKQHLGDQNTSGGFQINFYYLVPGVLKCAPKAQYTNISAFCPHSDAMWQLGVVSLNLFLSVRIP